MTLLLSTSTHFNNFLTRVKISFHETAKLNKSIFWARNLTTCWVHFRRWPKSSIISFWEPTTIMTLLLRTSTDLNKPLTRLKITFHETAQEYFLSSKFDHVLSTFFVDDLYQILPLFQNLLGLWHSYLGQTHLNKSLTRLKITFHETAQEYFLSSKFDNVLSTFS